MSPGSRRNLAISFAIVAWRRARRKSCWASTPGMPVERHALIRTPMYSRLSGSPAPIVGRFSGVGASRQPVAPSERVSPWTIPAAESLPSSARNVPYGTSPTRTRVA
jgi:hypothetical protein